MRIQEGTLSSAIRSDNQMYTTMFVSLHVHIMHTQIQTYTYTATLTRKIFQQKVIIPQ